ncbi:DinB family protein [Edaphobacter aggregans]|uniref:DinB family protein n=1 Tax=Edaphobacter aggregans TaxID=570835 RepID=UPI0005581D64|nr:DinB family protein [Edaphobacter aggregans]
MEQKVEPWLRGTRMDVDAVRRGVIHALELAAEDVARWCKGLSDEELGARPVGLAPVGFHLRHIARSLDRLLTYAEGQQLSERQLTMLKSEMDGQDREALFMEFTEGIEVAVTRVLAISQESYDQPCVVGRKKLPTTVGGLLVHCADHTQRHVGQAVTTAKVVMAMRER